MSYHHPVDVGAAAAAGVLLLLGPSWHEVCTGYVQGSGGAAVTAPSKSKGVTDGDVC